MNPEDYLPVPKGFATRAIHSGQNPDNWDSMCVVPPIVLSTTFKQYGPADFKKYEYGRSGNPSRDVLETCLASLEDAKHGVCFSSGLGAITGLLGMFQSGDHIITGDDIYGGSNRLFNQVGKKFGFEVSHVDGTDVNNVAAAIQSNTKLIWLETPTNPTMKVMDIKAISTIAKEKNIVLAVDNTFLTPYFQRPLELGADLTVYSLTKYMNGHSDVIMGAILTNNHKHHEKLRFLQNAMGIVPSPFDCSLVNRSLKTLAVRMRQHSKNGLIVAKFLETHPHVKKVLHPGLPSHPQHILFKTQTSGHSGMVTFYLKGELKDSKKFLSSLKVFTLAESLGGYESLAELPSVMTHASVPEEQRKILKIDDSLIRLSIGLEDVDDIIADLNQAFASI
ncbi:PREDICTED: putative cystathionine gamma-lyase 2 [Nicrophorus vespilloides]|uniref:cystathionine gamma-lyase n=1 Tax=Nicrophorus vespilloides TaxID=110193 RepID=A0ABM1MUJ4_NICVS|nr:PREDICTED: putative cystathionine gamma-lyase 2 [Nicrophorus vespilloides]XP_017778245.1 PREDICTED: putative cystathionine gamma-lyase 2 [Nicrophorus vespilloides]